MLCPHQWSDRAECVWDEGEVTARDYSFCGRSAIVREAGDICGLGFVFSQGKGES